MACTNNTRTCTAPARENARTVHERSGETLLVRSCRCPDGDRLFLPWRTKEESEQNRRDKCQPCRNEEQRPVIRNAFCCRQLGLQWQEKPFRSQITEPQDQEIEEPLCTRANIFREGSINEDVNCGEVKGVANSVKHL